MSYVKVPVPLMNEIVAILSRLPYASVEQLMPKLAPLFVEDDQADLGPRK